jgi:hypothetical protein
MFNKEYNMVSESFKQSYVDIVQEELSEGVVDKLKSAYRDHVRDDLPLAATAVGLGTVAALSLGGFGVHVHNEIHNSKLIDRVAIHAKDYENKSKPELASILKAKTGVSDEDAAHGVEVARSLEDNIHPKVGHILGAMSSDGGKLKIEGADGDTLEDQAKDAVNFMHKHTYIDKTGNVNRLTYKTNRGDIGTITSHGEHELYRERRMNRKYLTQDNLSDYKNLKTEE